MSGDLVFVRADKDKAVFDFRSSANKFAPNVTLISSDNIKVKGHLLILGSCLYFQELFNRDTTGNTQLVFHEDLAGDVLEFVVKYIYTGEYTLLDMEKLPEVIRATSKEKFNIPELAKSYLLKQLEAPEGLTQANWHIFYKNGNELDLGDEYCNVIYAFLKEKHSEFYKSDEFKSLTYEQICKIMNSPNRPFESNTTLTEATLIWIKEHTEAGMDKLAELSKICTNPVQNGNSNPHQRVNSPLSPPVLSVDVSLSSPISQPATVLLSDPHSATRKRARSISPEMNNNLNGKRSSMDPDREVELYQPPKYSWNTARLLFFGKTRKADPEYLWSYSFQTNQTKRVAVSHENFKNVLLASQDRIYSIRRVDFNKPCEVWSFPINDLENMDKAWEKGPNPNRARYDASMLLFKNTIYLIAGRSIYIAFNSSIEKWDIESKPGAWEKSDKHMLYYRDHFGLTLLNNVIYMIGGSGAKMNEVELTKETLVTAESYNIDDGTQSLIPNMSQARHCFRAVTLNDRIYAIGGCIDGPEYLSSVESYKPGDPSWTQMAPMNQPRADGNSFILDDMIYVVGGNNGKDPTMERYCPRENTWTMVKIKLPQWINSGVNYKALSSSVIVGPSN